MSAVKKKHKSQKPLQRQLLMRSETGSIGQTSSDSARTVATPLSLQRRKRCKFLERRRIFIGGRAASGRRSHGQPLTIDLRHFESRQPGAAKSGRVPKPFTLYAAKNESESEENPEHARQRRRELILRF